MTRYQIRETATSRGTRMFHIIDTHESDMVIGVWENRPRALAACVEQCCAVLTDLATAPSGSETANAVQIKQYVEELEGHWRALLQLRAARP